MNNEKSLSLPLTFGIMIIIAVLASSLTYYYTMSNLPTITTTITSPITITKTITATQSITTTKTSTETTTKYVTLSPSTTTVTLTVTNTPKTAPQELITMPRNDTAAQKLAELKLKQYLMTAIITWLVWMKSQSTPSSLPNSDPAAILATAIITRLASQDFSVLPPVTTTYSIEYTKRLVIVYPPQSLSSKSCMPVKVTSNAASVIRVSILIEPVNSTAITVKINSKLPIGSTNSSEVIVLAGKNTLRSLVTFRVHTGSNVTLVRELQVLRDYIPVMIKVRFGSLTHESGINESNGALIVKVNGSTIRVVKDAESVLKDILRSLNITVTYEGSERVANVIAPKYEVSMTGNATVRTENMVFSIGLNYSGVAYLIGKKVLVPVQNSINKLQVSVRIGSDTYCRYLSEPVVIHNNVIAVSVAQPTVVKAG